MRYRDFDVDLMDCGPVGYKYQAVHIDYDGPEDSRAWTGLATEQEAKDQVDEFHRDNLVDGLSAVRSALREIDDMLLSVMVRDRFSTENATRMQALARNIIERTAGMRKDS